MNNPDVFKHYAYGPLYNIKTGELTLESYRYGELPPCVKTLDDVIADRIGRAEWERIQEDALALLMHNPLEE